MRMMKTALGMGVALSLGLLLGVSGAEARGGFGGGGFHGGFGGGGMAFFPHHMGGFVGGGFPYDDYGYYDYGYYGGDCSIAYRNARASGSSYWWNRYYACVGYSY